MSASPLIRHRLAAGIDLGTTNSLVATVADVPPVAPMPRGRVTLRFRRPLSRKTAALKSAKKRPVRPKNRPAEHRQLRQTLSGGRLPICIKIRITCLTVSATINALSNCIRGRVKTPVEVSAEILKTLKSRAEETLGGDLVGVVITVPAYFDDALTPSHQRCRACGGFERIAPAQRTHRCRNRLRAGQRLRRRLSCTT